MRSIGESDKLSLSECRKILNKNGNQYTDEEILKIRNWLYNFTEITMTFLETKSQHELKQLKELFQKEG